MAGNLQGIDLTDACWLGHLFCGNITLTSSSRNLYWRGTLFSEKFISWRPADVAVVFSTTSLWWRQPCETSAEWNSISWKICVSQRPTDVTIVFIKAPVWWRYPRKTSADIALCFAKNFIPRRLADVAIVFAKMIAWWCHPRELLWLTSPSRRATYVIFRRGGIPRSGGMYRSVPHSREVNGRVNPANGCLIGTVTGRSSSSATFLPFTL